MEFIEAYKTVYSHLDPEDLEKEARKIFEAADADGSGFIDYGEFTTATINQRDLLNSQNIKIAFNFFRQRWERHSRRARGRLNPRRGS